MEKIKVLLAEDEQFIGQMIKECLVNRGFCVELVTNGNKAYSKFNEYKPDVCLLDINMPERNGFSLTSDIRRIDLNVPIIFISSSSLTEDLVRGFNLGANDYVKKPFSIEELIARINSQLRRSVLEDREYNNRIGDLYFNSRAQELDVKGERVRLTFRENALLKLLVEKRNDVLMRKTVLEKLWGEDNPFNSRSLDVFISKLRKHFKQDKSVDIVNVRGIGYKMICNN